MCRSPQLGHYYRVHYMIGEAKVKGLFIKVPLETQ